MRYSMTAFGRAETSTPHYTLRVELKSVNHRHLEIRPHLPDALRYLEAQIRELLQHRLSRGKIDIWLELTHHTAHQAELHSQTLAHYLKQLESQPFANALPAPTWHDLLILPNTLTTAPLTLPDDQSCLALIEEALTTLLDMRAKEGQAIACIINDKLTQIHQYSQEIRQYLPTLRQQIEQKLRETVTRLLNEVDPKRLEQELVHYLQRADIEEEIDRLIIHTNTFQQTLNHTTGAIGRRLDFLTQELNREANTLGAKTGDAMLTNIAIELKVLIEQIREQLQNLE